MEITRPTIMEVDIKAFKHNVKAIQDFIGNDIKIMPVIKANAYGTWINKVKDIVNQFEIVAVAVVDEAVELRQVGYNNEIFILNQPYIEEIPKILENNITIGVCEKGFIRKLGESNKIVKIHIEIETGMGRTGIKLEEIPEFIELIKQYQNIEIEGVYTHFSSADYDADYTNKQCEIFDKAIEKIKELVGDIKYIHCSASNGILNTDKKFNLVRPGIILYGYEPYKGALEKIDLRPVCKLKSKITFLKEVDENTSISYGRTFISNKRMKIATIPIGYADGLRRELSNKGEVVINGKRAPIIGKVCMDGFMADVTDIEGVSIGDTVYIWDNELITLEEIAEKCNTSNYEIMSTISWRVPRVFIEA